MVNQNPKLHTALKLSTLGSTLNQQYVTTLLISHQKCILVDCWAAIQKDCELEVADYQRSNCADQI